MQIVCPACASEYEIPTDRVGPEGRQVRCAACRETWFITPDDVATAQIAEAMSAMSDPSRNRSEDQAALDAWESALAEEGIAPEAPAPASPEAAPEPVAAPRRTTKRRAKPARKPRASLKAMAATVALGLSVAGIAAVALVARTSVVRAMPQSASLYASLGLPVNLRGIDFNDVVAFQGSGEGGGVQLVVGGDIVGVSHQGATVPPIEVELRDARDQTIYRWTIPAPRATLDERERARFRACLSAPPVQARSVQIRFADPAMAKPDASARRP